MTGRRGEGSLFDATSDAECYTCCENVVAAQGRFSFAWSYMPDLL